MITTGLLVSRYTTGKEHVRKSVRMIGKIHPSGFVQHGSDSASLVTAYAALRPRDGFSHPHQEHMKDTSIPAPEVDAEIHVPYARNSRH